MTAKRPGRPPDAPGIDWDAQPLGSVSDSSLAEALRLETGLYVSRGVVAYQRRKRGLPSEACVRYDWSKIPLGQQPDTVIAAELGTTRGVVMRARARLGITAFRHRQRQEQQ